MRAKRAVCIVVVLLLALPVTAEPAEGRSWWAWLAQGWQAVVRVVAGSETEPPPAEEPTAETNEPKDAVIVCLPLVGCFEVDDDGGPGMDPDG